MNYDTGFTKLVTEYLKYSDDTTNKEYVINYGNIKIDLMGAKKENVSVTVTGRDVVVKSTKTNINGQTVKYEKTFTYNVKYDLSTLVAKYDGSILEIAAKILEEYVPRAIKID